MNTNYTITNDDKIGLINRLQAFDGAGIDPAFDAECEELERQFAEIRFASTSNA
jgi:hypothetical protein